MGPRFEQRFWLLIFKGYSRREGAYGILIETELRSVPNPVLDQAQAVAVLLALIALQRVYDMTSSKTWLYIFTFRGSEYQSLLTSDDAITCHASWTKLIGIFEALYQHFPTKCDNTNIARYVNCKICGRLNNKDSDFTFIDPSCDKN